MDFDQVSGIEERLVEEVQHEGQPARVVGGSRLFDSSQSELWDALTNSERLPKWFLPISGELKLGGRFQLEGNAGGEIMQCDAPEKLNVTWECGGNVSWVSLHLEPVGEKTRLTLSHKMLQDPPSEEHWKKYGPGATGVGWDLGFVGLAVYIHQDGNADVCEASHKWMGSEGGKAFIRKSGQAWGDAHIASGESNEVALEMAEQTIKAYTGES